MNAYLNQYQSTQIDTASREQILIMLYDGAIRFTRQAISALEVGDRAGKIHGIRKAMAIVCEFRNTHDHKIGGEITANLDALYAFMIQSLTQANLKNDPEPLKVGDGLLSDLRATWKEAIDIARKEAISKQKVANSDYTPLRASL